MVGFPVSADLNTLDNGRSKPDPEAINSNVTAYQERGNKIYSNILRSYIQVDKWMSNSFITIPTAIFCDRKRVCWLR